MVRSQRELDGVAAVLANHLAYEERVLVDVLDRLSARSGSEEDRALRAPLEGMFDADWGAGHASYRPACQGDGFHGLWRTPRNELENGMPVVHRSRKGR